ncbi:MAG: ribosome-associated translation inhibitor RaiA [Thermomicrobia bacterium]|nr:ribosome-associated translation inhibitor RaiA [Thermomicrobia bacterium]
MELHVKPHQIALSAELQAYIDRRLGRLDRFLDRVTDAKLELREEQRRSGGLRQIAQLTIATNYALLRAEEDAADIHTAIDAVATKMERQIVRYRSKWKSRRHGHHEAEAPLPALEPDGASADEAAETTILRTKTFSAKPIDADEAIEQMELLGHTFFAFIDARSGAVNVVYRRRNGGYGLLQPAV